MPDNFSPPSADRQLGFHTLLVGARNKWLLEALKAALLTADPTKVKTEIVRFVPTLAQSALAAAGIRDEFVFPVPEVLKTAPHLVGYYRLLLGSPQKSFYGSGTGMGKMKSMEVNGTANASQLAALDDFCTAMCAVLADLVLRLSPSMTMQDVSELPLLTLGSQFQGGNNNLIGQAITTNVFAALVTSLEAYVQAKTATSVTVRNPSGAQYTLIMAGDPDISVESTNGTKVVAIEIKGGTDVSNSHNRAGEAEKSHIKAKNAGFQECWTLFQLKGLPVAKIKSESPTTDIWFDTAEVVGQEGPDWDQFEAELKRVLGLL